MDTVQRMGYMRSAYSILVGKHEGNRRLGRHSRRWENNIKMNRTKIWYECVD
jgi:hypothetical protein